MSYTHLTEHERISIFHCQGIVHQAELARRLKRHPATIRRELKRFRRNPIWPYYHCYLPDHAHRFAQEQRNPGRDCDKDSPHREGDAETPSFPRQGIIWNSKGQF